MKFFNPKLREFFEEKKDITLMGVMWAFYWRWLVLVFGAMAVFFLVITVLVLAIGAIRLS